MKTHPRSAKPSPRSRSPERKLSNIRKGGLPRSPPRSSSSHRPPMPRGRSPSMKRRPPLSRKVPHPSRQTPVMSRRPSSSPCGSPSSLDRVHDIKYEKKRKFSRSPPRRMPGPPRKHLPSPPRSRNGSAPSPEFESSKKKIRRDLPRMSPSQRLPEKMSHIHPENRIPHRSIGMSEPVYADDRNREYAAVHAGSRPTFSAAGHSREGYSLSSSDRSRPRNVMEASYPRSRDHEDYITEREKHYGQTLDERFRGFTGDPRSAEPRIQFSRSDLEKITIDIKRGIRDSSPTLRRIVNPSEVKLVRRPAEGHRPIFDREEIKHSPRDLREDPYNEQKYADKRYGLNYKELENYEITRHKFDTYRGPPLPPEGAYLSDKWQRYDSRKSEATSLDRDERSHAYVARSRSPGPYIEKSHARRSRSADRDFRRERYSSSTDHRPRPSDYPPESRRPLPNNPSDLRHSLAVKRKDGTLHDARQRIMERRSSGHEHPSSSHGEYRHYPSSSRRPPESSSERMRERRSSSSPPYRTEPSRSRGESSSWVRERSMERGRPREEKLPDFSQRPDRYKYQPWLEKPEMTPKGSSYFEHDDREGSTTFRGRGGSRGFRGRSLRGRGFRGLPRGSGLRGRGAFRTTTSPRGRGGYPPRRGGRYSPNLWEHDLYGKVTQDR